MADGVLTSVVLLILAAFLLGVIVALLWRGDPVPTVDDGAAEGESAPPRDPVAAAPSASTGGPDPATVDPPAPADDPGAAADEPGPATGSVAPAAAAADTGAQAGSARPPAPGGVAPPGAPRDAVPPAATTGGVLRAPTLALPSVLRIPEALTVRRSMHREDAAVEVQRSPRVRDARTSQAPAIDDLTRVHGLDREHADALRDAGITTWRDLADADDARVLHALVRADLRAPVTVETWAVQADFLARGDERGFAGMVSALAAPVGTS